MIPEQLEIYETGSDNWLVRIGQKRYFVSTDLFPTARSLREALKLAKEEIGDFDDLDAVRTGGAQPNVASANN